MNKKEFSNIRRYLGKTQKEIAQLLGTSLKAIQSFEQGWRNISPHTERQLYFLVAKSKTRREKKSCWVLTDCPKERRQNCPAWEFKCGDLCWFINGTMCQGKAQDSWKKKMAKCRKCEVFKIMTSITS